MGEGGRENMAKGLLALPLHIDRQGAQQRWKARTQRGPHCFSPSLKFSSWR